MQTWATFSITDHRKPIYRQALAIFDKIVVPIPKKPIGDQTAEELEQLDCEVRWLEEQNAAVRRAFDPDLFDEWQKRLLNESYAIQLNRDAYYDTRLMLAETSNATMSKPTQSTATMPTMWRQKLT